MKTIKDCYFKDYGNGQTYLSGLSIPKDIDGVCRNIEFIDCIFHAGCSVPYENCKLIGCSGTPNQFNEH